MGRAGRTGRFQADPPYRPPGARPAAFPAPSELSPWCAAAGLQRRLRRLPLGVLATAPAMEALFPAQTMAPRPRAPPACLASAAAGQGPQRACRCAGKRGRFPGTTASRMRLLPGEGREEQGREEGDQKDEDREDDRAILIGSAVWTVPTSAREARPSARGSSPIGKGKSRAGISQEGGWCGWRTPSSCGSGSFASGRGCLLRWACRCTETCRYAETGAAFRCSGDRGGRRASRSGCGHAVGRADRSGFRAEGFTGRGAPSRSRRHKAGRRGQERSSLVSRSSLASRTAGRPKVEALRPGGINDQVAYEVTVTDQVTLTAK